MMIIDNTIKNHNIKIVGNSKKNENKSCKCRKKTEFFFKGQNCREENVIYKVKIKTNNETKVTLD